MTTARELQARLQSRLARPSSPSPEVVDGKKWPRVSVDLPPEVHEALTRWAFEHGRVKLMHLGQRLFELLLDDEELQQRVLDGLPTLRRKAPR